MKDQARQELEMKIKNKLDYIILNPATRKALEEIVTLLADYVDKFKEK